uniref:Rhs family protein n=1 Tax=Rheinheimera sp. BAL341 TaxID=1708203 RepID=A0A486XHH7_9GAMM
MTFGSGGKKQDLTLRGGKKQDLTLRGGAVVESYGYDANGNRTSHSSLLRGIANQTASYVAGDQLAQSGNAVYSYDANGRLSQKTITENGETTATQYQYSSTGRLLAVTTADKAITYRHNALGQRVAKLVDGVVTEKYLWQNLTTLLAVYDANNNVKQRFEYGLSHTPVSFSQAGQRYYIQTDHLGSPRVISNATGSVIKTLSYDSYGNVISDSNPDFSIPFGFAGGLYDADTGLVRFGYRDYDPQTGRWTARDPIGFAGGDTNLYGYVLGDPVNFIDPSGLFALPQIPQGVVNAVTDFGDAISFGLTDKIRDAMGTNSGVDKCSSAYASGAFVANFVDLKRGAVSGARALTKGGARNSANAARLRAQLTGQEIAGGHAFEKHVLRQGEFAGLGIRTRKQFARHIEGVVNHPTATKQLSGGRTAYWDNASSTVVIRNPRAGDGGTAFQPANGRAYFDGLR